uniref:Wsv021-like protein n=1 Tax=Metapenaeus ensis nimavirus TaxID=2133794 RepID=A0A401IPB8_9VIRU|nr:MAG: wsv021-like protein [Metapenaeus ensis nimavirus]GBG35441.1 wsv021-like protein [Metapenaeus ensis nimavirus]
MRRPCTYFLRPGFMVWDHLVSLSKRADWPMILGVFFLTLSIGLITAIYIRYATRERLLARSCEDHFTSRYLPVAYLSSKSGKVKDMFLNPQQFVVFGILNERVSRRRHAMCTDQLSWFHFCLLAAAEVYQRIASPTGEGQFNIKAKDKNISNSVVADHLLLDNVIDSSIQDIVKPYMRYIFGSKTNVPLDEIEASMSSSDTEARGVSGIGPIGNISAADVKIISVL